MAAPASGPTPQSQVAAGAQSPAAAADPTSSSTAVPTLSRWGTVKPKSESVENPAREKTDAGVSGLAAKNMPEMGEPKSENRLANRSVVLGGGRIASSEISKTSPPSAQSRLESATPARTLGAAASTKAPEHNPPLDVATKVGRVTSEVFEAAAAGVDSRSMTDVMRQGHAVAVGLGAELKNSSPATPFNPITDSLTTQREITLAVSTGKMTREEAAPKLHAVVLRALTSKEAIRAALDNKIITPEEANHLHDSLQSKALVDDIMKVSKLKNKTAIGIQESCGRLIEAKKDVRIIFNEVPRRREHCESKMNASQSSSPKESERARKDLHEYVDSGVFKAEWRQIKSEAESLLILHGKTLKLTKPDLAVTKNAIKAAELELHEVAVDPRIQFSSDLDQSKVLAGELSKLKSGSVEYLAKSHDLKMSLKSLYQRNPDISDIDKLVKKQIKDIDLSNINPTQQEKDAHNFLILKSGLDSVKEATGAKTYAEAVVSVENALVAASRVKGAEGDPETKKNQQLLQRINGLGVYFDSKNTLLTPEMLQYRSIAPDLNLDKIEMEYANRLNYDTLKEMYDGKVAEFLASKGLDPQTPLNASITGSVEWDAMQQSMFNEVATAAKGLKTVEGAINSLVRFQPAKDTPEFAQKEKLLADLRVQHSFVMGLTRTLNAFPQD